MKKGAVLTLLSDVSISAIKENKIGMHRKGIEMIIQNTMFFQDDP